MIAAQPGQIGQAPVGRHLPGIKIDGLPVGRLRLPVLTRGVARLGDKQARRCVLPVSRHQGLGMLQGLAAQTGCSQGPAEAVTHIRTVRADAPQGTPRLQLLRALLQPTRGAHGKAPGIRTIRLTPHPVGTQGLQLGPALCPEQGGCRVVAL